MKTFLLSLLAILLLIEEWLWDILSAFGHYLAIHLGLIKFENWLIKASPTQALISICIPIVLVTPLNIVALWLLTQGLFLQGILLEIIAKLLGTLFIARFFSLSKQQLLTFWLIAKIYNTISAWLAWARQKVIETSIYQFAKQLKQTIKIRFNH